MSRSSVLMSRLFAVLLLATQVDCLKHSASASRRRARPVRSSRPKPAAPPTSTVLVCAGCGVECSGEVSFIDHINGAAHRKRCGETGYVGLLPNGDGLIPPLGPDLNAADEAWVRYGEAQQVACQRGAQSNRVEQSLESRTRNFKADPSATDLEFEPTLTKEQRAFLHKLAKRHKLGSKSRGHQEERFVTLYKLRKKRPVAGVLYSLFDEGDDEEAQEAPQPWRPPLADVNISPWAMGETERALRYLADRPAPPERMSTGGQPSSRRMRRAPRGLPPPPEALQPPGGPMAATREKLPVHSYRSALLEALAQRVSIVEGETGSGKTTQVAQYLLEAAAAAGDSISVVCTQPRRISAIGVAERVAAERGERLGQGAVGYAVRSESKQNDRTSLLFCTTGVLLRMLEEDAQLSKITHVIVDEVHERSVENDFLLLTLRRLLLMGGRFKAERRCRRP